MVLTILFGRFTYVYKFGHIFFTKRHFQFFSNDQSKFGQNFQFFKPYTYYNLYLNWLCHKNDLQHSDHLTKTNCDQRLNHKMLTIYQASIVLMNFRKVYFQRKSLERNSFISKHTCWKTIYKRYTNCSFLRQPLIHLPNFLRCWSFGIGLVTFSVIILAVGEVIVVIRRCPLPRSTYRSSLVFAGSTWSAWSPPFRPTKSRITSVEL